MITSALINVIGRTLNFFFNLLPNGTGFPQDGISAIVTIIAMSYQWEYIFPVSTMWVVMIAGIAFFIAWLAFSGVLWVMSMIRGN